MIISLLLPVIISILVFLVILTILVLIHEAGHYFVAKKFGIKVEEFGFGFPLTPALWQRKKGETIYSFYPVLIGGFVKLYGEDEAGAGRIEVRGEKGEVRGKKDEDRAFFAKPLWQRLLVIVAGVVMNTLLAAFVYYIFLGVSNFQTELPLIGSYKFFGVDQTVKTQVIVSEIEKNSPAQKAGITPFSTIQSIDGNSVAKFDSFATVIKDHAGKPMSITWKDGKTNKVETAIVVPRVNPPKGQGSLGVAFFPAQTVVLSYDTPVQKLFSGFIHPANLMAYNFDVLGQLISVSVKEKTTEPLKQSVSGPIGIGFAVGSTVELPNMQERVLQLLNLIGLLSISLAYVNVLPFPGLDGGRLLFIVIELITRRRMNPKVESYINAAGMSLLLLLIVFVTINDIQMHQGDILTFFHKLLRH